MPLTEVGGVRLEPVAGAAVAARLPEGTRLSYQDFSRCPVCGKISWAGAPARRIDELVRVARRG